MERPSVELVTAEIRLLADALEDIEKARISMQLRIQSLTKVFKIPPVVQVGEIHAAAADLLLLEKRVTKQLEKQLKLHPLGDWQKRTIGVGAKQLGRLLGVIGDPGERETVSQLWAYHGFHAVPVHPSRDAQINADRDESSIPAHGVNGTQLDVSGDSSLRGSGQIRAVDPSRERRAPKRTKGEKCKWSTRAKTRAILIAQSCIKWDGKPDKHGRPRALSPLRVVYDHRRAHTKLTHPEWTDQHALNDALRITAKAILKELWVESRRVSAISSTKTTTISRRSA